MTYGYMGQSPYYNPQMNFNQPQQFTQQSLSTTLVSDIAEAIATKPDLTGKPMFFYNKANEEIYLKQYDSTGSAPIKTYKLVVEQAEPVVNPVIEGIKGLDKQLNDIKKLLTPDVIEDTEKKNRR